MSSIRTLYVRLIFTLIAGVAFLNLSFVLAELKFLALENTALVQSLVNAGFEEETEHGTEGTESDNSFKETIEIAAHENLLHHEIVMVNGSQRNKAFSNISPDPGYKRKFSPPPEVRFA